MDLKTLKTLQAIVRHGSFNQAAEELSYAQSTVTMQIQKLEADLGVQLFERGKKVRLTEAGRLFYKQSLDIVYRMEQLQANLSDMHKGEAGKIRLGVTEPTASSRLPQLLMAFMREFPKIEVSLEIASTPALVSSLRQGTLDFALCSAPEAGEELYFHPLFLEKFVMLLPEDHPLAGTDRVSLADLEGHRLLITAATCPYRKKLERILQDDGLISIRTMEIGSMTALKHYVASGFGIALVPMYALDPLPAGTITREIQGASVDMLMGMLSRTGPLAPAAAKLYDKLRQDMERI
ncbi:DNA-binding transcriptional regulator, LysR family [Paenibacillus catalpae]|uniref:DNA-binding transcriptional regulator, LysR family n=1 Tax=Paenibacillus catalpae TaxID=1045775 RepID=A0A1I2GQH5_9BACL|nr:LysR family transcriptional regulator [Paenibacillus catalpae]SFF19249.1 DNA-binding transcriptional regulator, LysR family [Paenibacillus catalpae]